MNTAEPLQQETGSVLIIDATETPIMTLLMLVPRFLINNVLVTVLAVLSVRSRTIPYFSVTALHVRPPVPSTRTTVHHIHMMGSQWSTKTLPAVKSRIQGQGTLPVAAAATVVRSKMMIRTRTCSQLNLMITNVVISMIDQFVQTSPYTTAAITCGIKASSADYIAQKRQLRKRNENRNNNNAIVSNGDGADTTNATLSTTATKTTKTVKTDLSRNIAFLLYGALYQGMGQEYIYNHLYPLYFGTGTNVATVLTKVAFDLLLQTTLLTLPVAYAIKAIIYKYTFQEAFRRYIDDIMNHGLLIKYFSLWGPVQCITFSIIPERYRISFIAVVSFFWLIILSTISSRVRVAAGTNVTDATTTTTTTISEVSLPTPECELVDGLTCNIDG